MQSALGPGRASIARHVTRRGHLNPNLLASSYTRSRLSPRQFELLCLELDDAPMTWRASTSAAPYPWSPRAPRSTAAAATQPAQCVVSPQRWHSGSATYFRSLTGTFRFDVSNLGGI